MRVRGSVIPEQVTVEPYAHAEGISEVRVRENVLEATTEGEKEYEYDEYVFLVPASDNLKQIIEGNLKEWLVTGRNSEVNENASVIHDMKSALEIMGVNVNE